VRSHRGAIALVSLVLFASVAEAQEPPPEPPGPYVIDVRGAISGIPNAIAFFPTVTATDAIPARGFGFDVGGHVYPASLGHSRLGLGVNFMQVRGSVGPPDVSATVTAVAPQISFNFGTRSGWSTLSAGYGVARVKSRATNGDADGGQVGALNIGGGARWFLSPHAAVGFDVRFYRLAAGDTVPSTKIVAASAGLSMR